MLDVRKEAGLRYANISKKYEVVVRNVFFLNAMIVVYFTTTGVCTK